MAWQPLALLQDAGPGRNGRWALFSLLALLAWLALEQLSAQLWFLPAGLRLALLWLTPSRRWGWLALAEVIGQAIKSVLLGYALFTPTFLAVCVAPWLVYAAIVYLLRGSRPGPPPDSPTRMLLFLMAGLLGAAGVSPLLWMFLVTYPMSTADSLASMFAFMYGDLIGQLVLAPLLVAVAHGGLRRSRHLGLLRDLGLVLLAAMAMFLVLQAYADLATYVLLLAFAPLFFLGFRQGWAGGALGMTMLGLVVQGLVQAGFLSVNVTMLQLVLAVVGGGALVLGAASTALRQSHLALAERHAELAVKTRELEALAAELGEVGQRLVRLEEQGQRELASELEYELGHAIHALGTRISLAFRDVRDEQGTRLLESLREQVREIQDSLRRALRQLRPPQLDSHGLRQALETGPLREMLEDSGVVFEPRFEGDVDVLGEDARTTVYRICQAAVREAVRLDVVRRLVLALEVGPGEGGHRVALTLDLEFSPYAQHLPALEPVPGIKDRVMAVQGEYFLEPQVHAHRHLVRFVAGFRH
ncbi:MASE1 domain-containing protein [Arenimonas caeni]|jgi:two-component system sensor histidine kinase UhpB|uniref:MASE1 domain-containing protein n=1 Tax=Arenimonas caeni TaxID=2058085 RepID=UPI002A364165|nr:MASE1 domain-containing protein [Arenimonas caeni]MDY0022681.1 MASE1 domain-containing protein [Arenimonas caeni]